MLQDISWVEQKLQELVDIIPDLAERVDRIKANIVIELISDTQASCDGTTCTTLSVEQHLLAGLATE